MAPRASSRGGPLVALGAILSLWIVARVALSPYDTPAEIVERALPPLHSIVFAEPLLPAPGDALPEEGTQVASPYALTPPTLPAIRSAPLRWDRERSWAKSIKSLNPVAHRENRPPVGMAAGHHVLSMAALANLPLPSGLAAMQEAALEHVPFQLTDRVVARPDHRWSADGWLLLRPGSSAKLAMGAAPATYGASQMGAVLRYRIALGSIHQPSAYVRAATALHGAAEKEVAIGISARPIPAIALRAAVELRASDQLMGQQLRPAVMIVTEVQPIDLSGGSRVEFYGQAGYVGGEFATSFADAQVRGETRIAVLGTGELRAGAGAWAGAQKGATRVDIGPTATLGVPIGQSASARLALDWRIRVAGNAEPGSVRR